MKKLLLSSIALAAVVAAPLAKSFLTYPVNPLNDIFVIRNDCPVEEQIGVFQDHKVIAFVDHLKPGQNFTVPFKDTGSKPLVVFYYKTEREFVVVPLKPALYRFSQFVECVK